MIDGVSIQSGATGISVTGGTAITFSGDGLQVQNGIHVVDTSVVDKVNRPHATFKNKAWSLQSNGSYSKGKRSCNYTLPKTLANGEISHQVARWEFEIHPSMTDADIQELRLRVCQLIMDAELDSFYNNGTVK